MINLNPQTGQLLPRGTTEPSIAIDIFCQVACGIPNEAHDLVRAATVFPYPFNLTVLANRKIVDPETNQLRDYRDGDRVNLDADTIRRAEDVATVPVCHERSADIRCDILFLTKVDSHPVLFQCSFTHNPPKPRAFGLCYFVYMNSFGRVVVTLWDVDESNASDMQNAAFVQAQNVIPQVEKILSSFRKE
jgi:hypothetical protein